MWKSIFLLFSIVAVSGCSGSGNTPAADLPIVGVGQYIPPPKSLRRLAVAVPELAVFNAQGTAENLNLMEVASDELASLLNGCGRFDLTERRRLRQLLAEQSLIGMLDPGKLVYPADVHGFAYLLLGRISDLSVSKVPPPSKVSVAGVEQMMGVGDSYVPKLIISAKVNLSLVDAKTGAVATTQETNFHHVGTPKSMGLELTSEQFAQSSEMQLDSGDTRRVLRFVLDSAMRPLLPRIDQFAANAGGTHENLAHSSAAPSTRANLASQNSQAFIICPECGAKVSADAQFCPNCGHKLK